MAASARLALVLAALTVASWWAQSLPTLMAPPAGAHAWRETDGLIVARNYCEERTPFSEPHVDNRGDTPGRTGLEFPLLNWTAAALGCPSGDFATPWRVISFSLSILGALALFLFAWTLLGPEGAALTLAVFATSPLVPYFSRTTQPDAAAMSLALVGLALTRTRARALAPVLLGLAALLKLPAIVYALPIVVLLWEPATSTLRRLLTVAWCAVALVPAALWYRHARALERLDGLSNFGVTRTPSQLFNDWLRPDFWSLHFLRRPFDTWVFPLVSVLVLLVVLATRGRGTAVGRGLLLTWLAYVLLCGFSGAYHDYYGLLVLPVAALGGGWAGLRALTWVRARRPRLGEATLALFLAGAIGWQVHRSEHWWPSHVSEWQALTAFSQRDLPPTRITVFSDGSLQQFWFMHRRGTFGDPVAPVVPVGAAGVVDRTRLENAAGVEAALERAGCMPRFANTVSWVCLH